MNKAPFRVAKTMMAIPHEYTLRREWSHRLNDLTFAAGFIREHGYDEKFYSKTYRYYDCDGWKYWTMDDDITKTNLINRAKL